MGKILKKIIAVSVCILLVLTTVNVASAQTMQVNNISIQNDESSQIPSADPGESPSASPSTTPSVSQSAEPSASSSASPSAEPGTEPGGPSASPSVEPSENPAAEASSDTLIQTMDISDFAGGSGTAADPYLVSTPDQLNTVRNYPSACFLMTNDIDMTAVTSSGGEFYNSGAGWAPIAQLNGTFDGGGHKIIGLQMNRPNEYTSLFVNVNAGAQISNLGMVNSYIYGSSQYNNSAGGLCVNNAGMIKYCYNTGYICCDYLGSAGGIAGTNLNGGVISNCYNTGTVQTKKLSGWSGGGGCAGGIAGNNSGTIKNCFNTGGIADGTNCAGGIAGNGGQGITDCYNVGTVAAITRTSGGSPYYGPITGEQNVSSKGNGLYYYTGSRALKGSLNPPNQYGIPLAGDQMQQQSSFAEFDFNSVWKMGDSSYPYPILQGMGPVSIPIDTGFAGGSGLPFSPYQVSNASQLDRVRSQTGGYFLMTNDIDMTLATAQGGAYYNSGMGWKPIAELTGMFDGGGHQIIGLTINRPQENVGLFAQIDTGVVVYNLGMTGTNINGGHGGYFYDDVAGAICALDKGIIAYCYNTGHVRGDFVGSTGGIAGNMNGGIISNCYNTGTIDVDRESGDTGSGYTGGITGQLKGIILNCYNAGTVNGSQAYSYISAGGITGAWSGTGMYNCYNAGTVTSHESCGALVGAVMNADGDTDNSGLYYLASGNITGVGKGFGGPEPALGTALTAQQMQGQASFTGFDFDNVWSMGDSTYPYPILQGMQEPNFNMYSVTFNSQGGSPTTTSISANYGSIISQPTAPTKTGYTFSGWYKEAACINNWDFSNDKATSDISLYAKWIPNQYTVTFNSQLGADVSNIIANYNTTISQPAAPTRPSYMFGGWYKESGCINAWNFSTDTVTGNISLYAKWIKDTQPPALANITLNHASPCTFSTFTVTANNVADPSGVKTVQFAVWSDIGGQDDLQWYNGVSDGMGNWTYTVNALNHKNDVGIYNIHVYGTDSAGNFGFMGMTTIDMEQREHTPPTLGSIALSANPCKTPTFKVTARGVSDPSGVKNVQFAVWSDNNGQDDLRWYNGVSDGKGNWSVTINAANHKNDVGIYHIHAYGTDKLGNFGFMGQTTIDMEQRDHTPPAMGSILLSANPCTTPNFKVTAHGVSDDRSGVKTVQFAVWSQNNGQDDLKWYTAKSDGKGNWTATINVSEHKNDAGIYNIHVYGTDKTGNQGFMGSATIDIK